MKIYPAELNAPRRELFVRIFISAVALSVSRQINFCVCLHRTSNTAVPQKHFLATIVTIYFANYTTGVKG